MAALSVSRALSNSIRQFGRTRPSIYAETFKRAASTKHPAGFSPPSTEDLTELRERVQEFTSNPCYLMHHVERINWLISRWL